MRAEVEHWEQLAQWVNDDPEPQHARPVAQPGPQFIELEVGEAQLLQPVVMQVGAVLTSACQPAGNRLLSMAEDPARGRNTQPFGQHRQHQPDTLGGGFQTVEGRMTARAEGRSTGLTAQRLDALGFPVGAIADQRMHLRVRDAVVGAGGRETGKAISVDAFGRPTPTPYRTPGSNKWRRCSRYAGRPGWRLTTRCAIAGAAWCEQSFEGRV